VVRYWTQTPPAGINSQYKSLYCGGNIVGITGINDQYSGVYPDGGFSPTVTGLYQISANFLLGAGEPESITFGHWNPAPVPSVAVFDRISGTVTNSNNASFPSSTNVSFVDILTAGQGYAFVGGGLIASGGTLTIYDNSQVTFSLLSTNVTPID